MFICTTFANLIGALDSLKLSNVDYSISFEGYGSREKCKFKINFKKDTDSLAFKIKYGELIGH